VGIAQALLNDPEVLILDEPTGGLDPGERVRFRNLLSEFAHDRIVLISTHIVPDVEYIATCHAIIKGGKLLATGTTEELTRLVEGKVWSCTIPAEALPEYESKFQITNLRNENDGSVSVRYLSEQPCSAISSAATPRLEDLYLWMFPEGSPDRRYQ
ncbi:MAG: ABC transporter ATP-binding protein, partial [Oscillospiraceae bacterium]|nr:ABC transporter ATP-binding protein [Oscillospiraceae bacterium]